MRRRRGRFSFRRRGAAGRRRGLYLSGRRARMRRGCARYIGFRM